MPSQTAVGGQSYRLALRNVAWPNVVNSRADGHHFLITFSVYFCVHRDGRLGVAHVCLRQLPCDLFFDAGSKDPISIGEETSRHSICSVDCNCIHRSLIIWTFVLCFIPVFGNFVCFIRAAISAYGALLSCSSHLDAVVVSLLDVL